MDFSAITAFFQEIKKDKGWNKIFKTVFLILFLVIGIHILWIFRGKHTKLWFSEHNKTQPCQDTLYIRDTIWKHDTIRLSVVTSRPTTQNKTEGNSSPNVVDARGAKNVATGQNGHAGDVNNFPSEMLTDDQFKTIFKDISDFIKANKNKKCIIISLATGASGRIQKDLEKRLKEMGFDVMLHGQTSSIPYPYILQPNGDCITMILGHLD